MNILLFWIGVGIIFLIVEIITSVFYGLSLAIAAFCVAAFVWANSLHELTIFQGAIFVLVALLMSYLLPKILMKNIKDTHPQGLDMYIGNSYRIREFDEDFKIKLDGVYYVAISDDDLFEGDFVTVVDRR